jgi:2-aminoadipate transaminase
MGAMVKSTLTSPPLPPLGSSAARVGSSAIRDLLALAERPEVISLAGGLPDARTFPVDALAAAAADALADDPGATLQYGPTEGDPQLRDLVAHRLGADRANVTITSGAQQALQLVARAVLDPGDVVALADPAYVGALQAFRSADARLAPLPSDHHGLQVQALVELIDAGTVPSLVYVTSSFDNPTGATLAGQRRVALAELAEEHGFWIVDDDPYGELRWAGSAPTPLRELTDRTIVLGSTSKILSPGLRVGWASAPVELSRAIVVLKQSTDLHTSALSQQIVRRALGDEPAMATHLAILRSAYQRQAGALADALDRHLPGALRFGRPDGGMFLWAELAPHVAADASADQLLERALACGTAFVPGSAFAVEPTGGHRRRLRLSFATATEEELDEAARRLAGALALG